MSWRSSFVERSLLLLVVSAGSLVACRPAPGRGATLQVVTAAPDADADVWVDGNYVGRVGDLGRAAAPIALAPGKHRVEVRKPGRFPVQRTIEVDGSAPTIRVEAELLEDP
jgi:hypothetical protein